MKKNFLIVTALGLLVSLILAACGDNTAITNVQPAVTAGTTSASTTIAAAATTAMASMTTASGASTTAMAMTTAAAGTSTTPAAGTTGAASATTAANPGTTMANMTTAAPATTAMAGMTNTPPAGVTTAAAGSMPGMDHGSMTPSASDPMTESLQKLTGQEFETKFMQNMIVHHQSAIDMAKLVPTNTKRPELLKLSQDIITAQTKEISDMAGWLSSWYNARPLTDSMSVPGMADMMGQMDKLKAAKDAQFDEMFLQMMIVHHQQAVNMANLLPAMTQRPELLKLGQDIIKAQTAEIEQMKGWQKAWNLKA